MNLPALSIQEWDLILKIVAGILAVCGFLFGLNQYKKAQRWQKAGILLSLIDSFERDKQIESACAMLDWDEREVQLSSGSKISFRNAILVSALRTPKMDVTTASGSAAETFSAEESEIRDVFDAFFDFFDKLYAFQKSGLLDFKDYSYFYYWLELLDRIGSYKENPEIKPALDGYIAAYRFDGIRRLLEQYRATPQARILIGSTASPPSPAPPRQS
jgi:hypothetical protein